jgi:ABC-2 type transport system ATP-binding protein
VPPYYLTGRDFLAFMLHVQQRRYDEAEVTAMFGALDLDPAALGKPVRAYSKGMTQKLGLAACFLGKRDLYVLDEPMSGLDPIGRKFVADLIADLNRRGTTVLFSSHILSDIERLCHRVVILNRGVVAAEGRLADLVGKGTADETLESLFVRKALETGGAATP